MPTAPCLRFGHSSFEAAAVFSGLNRHGDLRWTFNTTTGATTDTNVMDPFGKSITKTGTTNPNIGFQGDWTDPTSGDVWMGARWYTPANNAFRSRDTYSGRLENPVSLNRYTYAFDNPLRFFDPDGRCPDCADLAEVYFSGWATGMSTEEIEQSDYYTDTRRNIEQRQKWAEDTATAKAEDTTEQIDLTRIPVLRKNIVTDIGGRTSAEVRLEYVDFTRLWADEAKALVYESLGHCYDLADASKANRSKTCVGYAALHQAIDEFMPERPTLTGRQALQIGFAVVGTIGAGFACGAVSAGTAAVACSALAAGALTIGSNAIAGRDLLDGVAKNMAVAAALTAVIVAAPALVGAARAGFAARVSDDVAQEINQAATAVDNVATKQLTNGTQFETLYEAPITGTTRGAHRAAANRNLLGQLEADDAFRQSLDDMLGTDVVGHMQSGSGALKNPPGTAWHHPSGSNNSMILLRNEVHAMPELQGTLHPGPNGSGGFAEFFG